MSEVTDRDLVKKANKLTRSSPFFAKFNQLKYQNIKGYIQYENVTFQLARLLTCFQFFDPASIEGDFNQSISLLVLDRAYQEGFAAYWLDENLFDAFNNTNLPLQLGEIKQVVPCGLLFLPPKLKNPDGQPLKWILFYHKLAGEKIPPIDLPNFQFQVMATQDNYLAWLTILDDNTQYSVSRELKFEEGRLNYDSDNFHINQTLEYEGKNVTTQTEKEFSDRVTELLIQVFLYLQLKPEAVQPLEFSAAHPRSKRLGKQQNLAPNIIGRNYQVKAETSGASSEASSRKSPITHWRRGFYKWQPYGSRQESKHKLIWIEPVLVNG